MIIKKTIIMALALIGTSLFAKGPLLEGVFQGPNPLDAHHPVSITFKLENSDTKVVKCNFNFQCDNEESAAKLGAILNSDIFAPNQDHGWRAAYQNEQGQKVFEILFNDPSGQDGIVLRQLGLGIEIPLKKVSN